MWHRDLLHPWAQRRWLAKHQDRLVKRPRGRITYAVRGLEYVHYPGRYSGAKVLLEKMSGTSEAMGNCPTRYTRVSMREVAAMEDLGPAPVTAAEVRRRLRDVSDGSIITTSKSFIRVKGLGRKFGIRTA